MLSDRRHPRFRNLNSTVPVDVVRVKSYVNSLFNSTRVPVRVWVNKLNLVPERIMPGLIGMFRNGVEEAFRIGLHLNNINRNSGIEIPEAWMPTIRQHSSRSLPQRTAEGTVSPCNNSNNDLEVRDKPINSNHGGTNSSTQ